MHNATQQRAIGALIGSAVGDALGAPFEFGPAGAYRQRFPEPVIGGTGEMFALHLGGRPLVSTSIRAGDRQIDLGWTMAPAIGSLRRSAEELGLGDGDWLFVRRSSPSEIAFIGLPAWRIAGTSPRERLCLLVGADESRAETIDRTLADALGLDGAAADRAAVRDTLRRRGELDLVELLDQVED